MKIRDFIKMDIDIDVCDDYDERCYIAFCGPLKLTDEGIEEFGHVLDMSVEVPTADEPYDTAILTAHNAGEAQELKRFFYSAAGYCPQGDWYDWFIED